MQRQPWPVVLSEQHGHVHPPKRVGCNRYASDAESFGHVPSLSRIALPDEDAGRVRRRTRGEEHDVQAFGPQRPRGGAGEPWSPGPVQYLDSDAATRARDGIRMPGHLLGPRPQDEGEDAQEREHRGQRQRDADDSTRLFQKPTVESRSGHPDRTTWAIRSAATSASTPAGSEGKRAASSARC